MESQDGDLMKVISEQFYRKVSSGRRPPLEIWHVIDILVLLAEKTFPPG